eukprot:1139743-Pelagomonas_calceolata.AAC.2
MCPLVPAAASPGPGKACALPGPCEGTWCADCKGGAAADGAQLGAGLGAVKGCWEADGSFNRPAPWGIEGLVGVPSTTSSTGDG